jgi:crotonobetainyl-CoA:carnitine CoA-transferase CaiB-like acyl-CoA transferase
VINEGGVEPRTLLQGVRVLEIGNELSEYCGRLLAVLGADVLKIEPPSGEITRTFGPFLDDVPGPDRSLHYWHNNLGKRSRCIDLDNDTGRAAFKELVEDADVLLTSRTPDYMRDRNFDHATLVDEYPSLVYARISPFGDDGPWHAFKGSDLVHMALGGIAMNCGYDPDPFGEYDTPPVVPQMWLSYQVAGEMTVFATLAALYYRMESGSGQYISTSVHDAVSKNTESDLPNWLYLSLEHQRQTCRHSNPSLSPELICRSKDGRWHLPYRTYMTSAMKNDVPNTARLLAKYGMGSDLSDPRYDDSAYIKKPTVAAHIGHVVADFFGRIRTGHEVWTEAQSLGLPWAPIRRPEENIDDPHWQERGTFVDVPHPELGRSFIDVGQKWVSTIPWKSGLRVPTLGEDATARWKARPSAPEELESIATRPKEAVTEGVKSWRGAPFALANVRIIDLSWLIASGGAGRFLAAMGAEVIKVEHHSRPDHMRASWVGRLPNGEDDASEVTKLSTNRSGAFMETNAGKLSVSLDLKQPLGMELLLELIRSADAILSGFSPGTMARLGIGYETLQRINPSIVVVEQSAMGNLGTYGTIRGYGPTAQAFSGLSEMSGLPEPFAPAGIGYSFLDMCGAYNVANALMAGIYHARQTGVGCYVDASQVEAGIYLTGTAVLDYSANGRRWERYGNRSPYKLGAPHGIYRTLGRDRWLAVSCFSENEWVSLARVLGHPEWTEDDRFLTLTDRARNQDELDYLLNARLRELEGYRVMATLQAAGVPAGVCQTARDRCDSDPQLAHGGWLVDLPQTDMGTWPAREAPFAMSVTPPAIGGRLHRNGPNYGEDNEYVLKSILGLPDEHVRMLMETGVVGG